MKKILFILLAVLSVCAVSAACAETAVYPEMGLIVNVADDADVNFGYMLTGDTDSYFALMTYYLNQAAVNDSFTKLENLTLESDDQEAIQAANDEATHQFDLHYQPLYTIFVARKDNWDGYAADMAAHGTYFGENSTHIYTLILEEDSPTLAEEDREPAKEALAYADKFVHEIQITEIEKRADEMITTGVLAGLDTVDMNGNPVDASIISKADLTILHVWGTDCSPCIAEMPELAAWAEELPENVQVIGLVNDVHSSSDKTFARAEKILSKSKAAFVNLMKNDSLLPLTDSMIGTPTTYFLDRNGDIYADPVMGANIDLYKQVVDSFLHP